jgi:hypothetical protein
MALVFQVLGVLAGGVILSFVLARGRRPSKRLPMAGVGLAGALVACVLFLYHVYQNGSELPGATAADSAVSSFAAQHAGDPNAFNAFLVWARTEMLADTAHELGTYYLEPHSVLEDAELGQWSTYELLPERATSKLSEADWIVFYGVIPTLTAEQHRQFGQITAFSPGYALALRSDAH